MGEQFSHALTEKLDRERFGNTLESRVVEPEDVMVSILPPGRVVASVDAVDRFKLRQPPGVHHALCRVAVQPLTTQRMPLEYLVVRRAELRRGAAEELDQCQRLD